MPDDSARRRWERRAEWPLTTAAVAFLAAYAWPVLDPGLPALIRTTCTAVTWIAWTIFAVDYVARLILAEDRPRFVRRHVFDLLVIILPLLRPLRLLRLVTTLTILSRRASSSLRGRVAIYGVGGSILLGFCASVAILDVERDAPAATITTFGDALWWAITTMSTVGYGDHFPVTTSGRWIAAGLMLTGIAILGLVSASLASWLVQRVTEIEETGEATQDRVEALTAEVARLAGLLETVAAHSGPGPADGPVTGQPAQESHSAG